MDEAGLQLNLYTHHQPLSNNSKNMKINDYILFDHLLDVFNYEAGLGEKLI